MSDKKQNLNAISQAIVLRNDVDNKIRKIKNEIIARLAKSRNNDLEIVTSEGIGNEKKAQICNAIPKRLNL